MRVDEGVQGRWPEARLVAVLHQGLVDVGRQFADQRAGLAPRADGGWLAMARLAGFVGHAVVLRAAIRVAILVSARRVVDDELDHHRHGHRQ